MEQSFKLRAISIAIKEMKRLLSEMEDNNVRLQEADLSRTPKVTQSEKEALGVRADLLVTQVKKLKALLSSIKG